MTISERIRKAALVLCVVLPACNSQMGPNAFEWAKANCASHGGVHQVARIAGTDLLKATCVDGVRIDSGKAVDGAEALK